MRRLTISNDLLGDKRALQARWDQEGYWFFKDVLDIGPIERLRDQCLQVLADAGVVDPGDPVGRYNGGDLAGFDIEDINSRGMWVDFVAQPGIRDFFHRITGEAPFWIPAGEMRVSAPSCGRPVSRFDFIHRDGHLNRGLHFMTCWMPLVDIDAKVGGVALAVGLHKVKFFPTPIPVQDIPADCWSRSDYRPGDVLMFDSGMPHSGLGNRSDRFRLSVDARLSTNKAKEPLIGPVVRITADRLTVQTDRGEMTAAYDAQTLFRKANGVEVKPGYYRPGDRVLVAVDEGLAISVRPTRDDKIGRLNEGGQLGLKDQIESSN